MRNKTISFTLLAFAALLIAGMAAVVALSKNSNSFAEVGKLDPLIAFHIPPLHAGLVWKQESESPKLLFFARHTEMRGTDIVRIEDEGIDKEQTLIGDLIRDPNIFPFLVDRSLDDGSKTFNETLRASFKNLVNGGFLMQQGPTQSIPTRILSDLKRENTQLFDPSHPDAFKNADKHDVALHTENDHLLNAAAFEDAGFSRGLNYNIYCSGHAMLADGRLFIAGGHDMAQANGVKKTNIFDPESEKWLDRDLPCAKAEWENDRFGKNLFSQNPKATHFTQCNVVDKESRDPSHSSDMKYERWYPTAITLPDGKVLIVGGHDQNEKVGPNPDTNDAAFIATRIIQAVPEIYDPKTDTTIALENARKVFPEYAQAHVVQTGPKENDWKVCMIDGNPADPSEASPVPSETAKMEDDIHHHGPNSGATFCLDVLGALADPDREVPAENHWEFLDEAQTAHGSGSTADLLKIASNGSTEYHKVAIFGGADKDEMASQIVEMINYTDDKPKWKRQDDLLKAASSNTAIPLPNGQVLIVGGRGDRRKTYEKLTFAYQMFNPDTGHIKELVTTTVPRGEHSNAFLMPDATVLVMGGNRTDAVPKGDKVFPRGDPDLGVNTARIYKPPYLFNKDGSPAHRPVIADAPHTIFYGTIFDLKMSKKESLEVEKIVIIRTGINTHALSTDIRYVQIPFYVENNGDVKVKAPKTSVQAMPGDYMLFVVDNKGVPSKAAHVRLGY